MSLSTMYVIAVSIVPAALGALLLTLVSVDALRSKAGRAQVAEVEPHVARYGATDAEPESPGFGSLFHHGATS